MMYDTQITFNSDYCILYPCVCVCVLQEDEDGFIDSDDDEDVGEYYDQEEEVGQKHRYTHRTD